ncbi:hypothetical protein BO71DRAFT_30492 [Aspergillus ellipticus CBS 707.79]|uniref:Uncharacterized protein n=1 Tax=Aspergillus ellipticus CBS 707.79 TaxID=1448320 RepID=A0A319D4R1_9EURO|nr:hypothetical protein BO71DRAFT_30492 [Aspergillus ellipticus CBS 707.79]
MTGQNTLDICCLGPGETTVNLKAVVATQLKVNILTRKGFRALEGVNVEDGEVTTFYDSSDGASYAVRDVLQLKIWKKGQGKSGRHRFYVATDDSIELRHQCHAILGGDCYVGDKSTENDIPVAVSQLSKQSKDDKEKQDKDKKEKQARLEQQNKERRDREKKQAEQKK